MVSRARNQFAQHNRHSQAISVLTQVKRIVTLTDMSSDREQIAEVLTRYATAIDRKDWSLFKTCWAPDAVADYGQLGHFTDVEALTDVFSAAHDPLGPTYHRISRTAPCWLVCCRFLRRQW